MVLLLASLLVQSAAGRAMAGRTGAVVVLDARTGAVIAEHRPDIARRVRARPGSSIKPFLLAALLASGRLDGGAAIPCRREVRIGGRRFDCTHPQVPVPLRASEALAYSCNHFFATVSRRLTPRQLAQALQSAGDAQVSTEPELQALGEADISVSPLGFAQAYRALALRLAREPKLQPLRDGLEGCVKYGTGQLAAAPGLEIAGKTGTAGHAWFAGFAPARDPQIVVVVYLERGQGGADAAPIAGEIFRAFLKPPQRPGYTVRLHWSIPEPGAAPRTVRLAPEEYVAAALAGEATVLRSDEALKAMAVAARTYARRFAGRHAKEGFDFCDTTHCQDVRLGAVTERVRRAAAQTEGEMLWFEGAPVAAYYHRACGGVTEAGEAGPYLVRQPDRYCGRADWTATLSKSDIASALRGAGFSTRGGRFEILDRTPSGRARTVRFGALSLPAGAFHTAIGQTLGWNLLRSTFYDARDTGAAVEFRGRGAGHGIGLCQEGAAAMGAQGRSYREILAYYYPGTIAGRGAQGFRWTRSRGERAEIWTVANEPDLSRLVDRAIAEAERRSRIALAGRPQFRFYPTVAAFRDATGEAGSVAAITRGNVVHLQPAAALRAVRTLDRTLLHEALHLALESRAASGVPLWFREGLAGWLSDGDANTRVGRLVSRWGQDAVLRWLERGLPPEADPQSTAP